MRKELIYIVIGAVLLVTLIAILFGERGDSRTKRSHARSSYSISHKNEMYGNLEHQKFDFYLSGDGQTVEDISLVILLHSGAFITGDKRDDEIVELAENLAKRGINVATLNYSQVNADGEFFQWKSPVEVIKDKIYRSFQDLSLSVRYFRDNSEEYGINSNQIFIAGYSAGGIIGLSTAFIDREDFTKYFNTKNSCIHCVGTTYSDFKIKGVISISGAMFDRLSIDQDDRVPTLLIHGTKDGIVPYNKGKPFEKFTKGVELDIPGISHQLAIGEDRVVYDPKFAFQEQYIKFLRNSIFPNLYGPGVIVERMRDNNSPVILKNIKGGSHNLFYNTNGTRTKYSREIVNEIVSFVHNQARQ